MTNFIKPRKGKHAIITSMSCEYFKKYGINMLSTLQEHSEDRYTPIFIFTEEYNSLGKLFETRFDPKSENINLVCLESISPGFNAFRSISKKSKVLQGFIGNNKYSKTHNIDLWCRPLFAMLDGFMLLESYFKFVHWLDADVIAFDKYLPILDRTVPENCLISSLPRDSQMSLDFNIETGYVGFNCSNKSTKEFVNYTLDYTNSFKFLELNDWTDCTIMANSLKYFANMHNTSVGDWLYDLAYYIPQEINHRFVYSHLLGACFDHLKGDRKESGKSHILYKDLIVSNNYWNQ